MKKTKVITSIGGSALIEGIMMRGPKRSVAAVRKPDGTIEKTEIEFTPLKEKYKILGWPVIRGLFSFVDSMRLSYKSLSISAKTSMEGLEVEEDSKIEKWLTEKLGDKLTSIIMAISMVIGVALAVLLFFFVPSWLYRGVIQIAPWFEGDLTRSVFEGLLKIGMFIAYIALCSLLPDMKRVFQYHGAEHKTIFCYEYQEELTVENVRKQSRFHPRCGTSFLIVMLIVSIIIGFFIKVDNVFIRVPIKILLLPLTMGLGYELIKLCGKYQNRFTAIISAPGMWAQRITTREPDDSMIEIAIAAMTEVIPADGEDLVDKDKKKNKKKDKKKKDKKRKTA